MLASSVMYHSGVPLRNALLTPQIVWAFLMGVSKSERWNGYIGRWESVYRAALRCALLGLVITFSSGQVLAQGVTDAVTPRASLGDAEKKKTSSEPGGFHTSTGDAPVSSETKSYGPVGRNENILMIAQGLPLHEQFSVYQIMRGFYLKNPEAFTNGNISLLREGVMLTIPDVSTTGDVSRPQAIEFVLGATFNIPNLMASKEVLAETTEVSPGEVLPDKEPAELGEAVVNQDIPEDKEVLVETAAASSGEPLPDEEPTELGMEVVNQDITGYMGSDFPLVIFLCRMRLGMTVSILWCHRSGSACRMIKPSGSAVLSFNA